MYGSNSVFSFSSNSYTDSLQSSGYSVDENSSLDSLCRPSAKSIYLRRKEYSESINKQLSKFQYKVEHLLTCELGVELTGVQECVERVRLLEETGCVWGQDVLLEVNNTHLLLTDVETKVSPVTPVQEELDSVPLDSVLEVTAVMDSCVYNSLLTVSVQDRVTSVFIFQSDNLSADVIKRDLERVLQRRTRGSAAPDRGRPGVLIKRDRRAAAPPAEQREHHSEPLQEEWTPDYSETLSLTPPLIRHQPISTRPEPLTPPPPAQDQPKHRPAPSHTPYTETQRNVDILNHLINDIEEFAEKVAALEPKTDKKKKKKKKKQKPVEGFPSEDQFIICLQKIKMAFNVLSELNGQINKPSAADLVHCLFSILELVVSVCEDGLACSVVAPLLEPECVRFLSEEATPDEDQLWQSLGDTWNIPSTKWPEEEDDDVLIFTPVFNDGWEPPELTHTETKQNTHSHTRQDSQRSTGAQSVTSLQTLKSSSMRVLCDFWARNDRELSVKTGETVELLDMSKRWWKVRNGRGQEGFIPNNVLKLSEIEDSQQVDTNPVLNRKSRPEEVKAWLEFKGFNKITVRCLGGLSGVMLLGMSRDELKVVCPEEGGRVYYQLQNIKSALAMAREVSPLI